MIRILSLLFIACGLIAPLLPMPVHAEPAPLPFPPGFMKLEGVRGARPLVKVANSNHAAPVALRADAQALPSGFMPIDRKNIRPLNPSRNSAIKGSVHMIRAKKPVAIEESDAASESTAMDVLGSAEQSISSVPVFRDVVRKVSAKLRQAWPLPVKVEQKISSHFGIRRDPFTKQPKFHEGVDIAAVAGTPVLASADGIVETVTRGPGFGKYITIKHRDGTTSTYGHLSAQSVFEGQQIHQGQKLGEVGSTGRSTAAHLHFQMEENGIPVNPLASITPPWSRAIGVAMAR